MAAPRYLLDTNVVSEPARPRPAPEVVARLRAHGPRCAIAATVLHELEYGVARLPTGRRREELASYLDSVVRPAFPVLPYDAVAAAWHARERARLESAGRPRPFADGTVAAVAAAHGLVLVTRNTADFDDFEGLTVEDWFAPLPSEGT